MEDKPEIGGPLLLDTCVYPDVLRETSPKAVDTLFLLRARGLGAAVLTANTSDFDSLMQIVPRTSAVFYRANPT